MIPLALEGGQKRGLKVTLADLLVGLFVVSLFSAQVVTGTPAGFAAMVSLFIALGTATIKVLGGPFTLQGASVLALMLQHVIVSQIAKVIFLQSATDRLLVPYTTISVYVLAMVGILLAAVIYRTGRIDKIKPLFLPEFDTRRLAFFAVTLSIFSVIRYFLIQRFGVATVGGVYVGGWVGPLRQFGFLSNLAVAAGTALVIIKSDGKRCVGFWNGLMILASIAYGILGAGRQDTVMAVVTFLFTLFAFRFKLRVQHYAFVVLAAYVFQFIFTPYALYAREEGQVRVGTFDERVVKAANLLADVALSPGKYREKQSETDAREPWTVVRNFYYGKKISTLDRYSVIISADNIIYNVLQQGPQGGEIMTVGFNMLLPRFLNPSKEALGTANQLAHFGQGLVGETDPYTQITLGFIPESFYAFGWLGVLLVPMIVSFVYFTVYRLLFKATMFGNIYVVSFMFITTWSYSESTVQSQTLASLQTPMYFLGSVVPLVLIARTMTKKVREAPFVYEVGSTGNVVESPQSSPV